LDEESAALELYDEMTPLLVYEELEDVYNYEVYVLIPIID
jgi:hypothetical protein